MTRLPNATSVVDSRWARRTGDRRRLRTICDSKSSGHCCSTSLRAFALGLLVFVLLLPATASMAQEASDGIPTPPPDGLELQTWSSAQVVADRRRVAARVNVPAPWAVRTDLASTLFEPEPNPLDLGVLVVVGATSDLAAELTTPDGASTLVTSLVATTRESRREPVEVSVLGEKQAATLITIEATFDDGRPAHLRALHLAWNDVILVVIVGVSDEGHGPWRGVLDDVLASVQLVDPTKP